MTLGIVTGVTVLLAGSGGGDFVPRGTRVEVFQQIFDVFLVLGTLVGVVVIAYMTWKAYKYRSGNGHVYEEIDRPQLGELPTGSGGGRKLFVSFGMSAIIVVSLITWTYGTLLYVEDGPTVEQNGDAEPVEIEVIGSQFTWEFVYPNGHRSNVLRAPADQEVRLRITSADVFHNFGIPELRVKDDAIPGQTTETWFIAEEPGNYTAHCYELCGSGHSYMDAEVVIMEPEQYESWYANTTPSNETASGGGNASDGGGSASGGDGATHARLPREVSV